MRSDKGVPRLLNGRRNTQRAKAELERSDADRAKAREKKLAGAILQGTHPRRLRNEESPVLPDFAVLRDRRKIRRTMIPYEDLLKMAEQKPPRGARPPIPLDQHPLGCACPSVWCHAIRVKLEELVKNPAL